MSRRPGGRLRGPGLTPAGLGPAGGALLAGLLFTTFLTLLSGNRTVVLLVDNGGQLLAATLAAVVCGVAARRGDGSSRRTWGLLAVGVGCWAGGQAVWSLYEVVLGQEVPFPSPADIGFLLFPVIASVGLLGWLRGGDRVVARARDLLDGVVIAGSLLALSWATTLGSVVAVGAENRLALVLSLAYPVGDVVMATVVLLTLVRARPGHRSVQLLVAAGLGGLAVADSAYVYLVNAGTYSSGNLISAGWLTGFLLIAAGAFTSIRAAPTADGLTDAAPTGAVVSRLGTVLPYLPLLVAEVTVLVRLLEVPGVPLVDLWLGVGLIALVLARQLLALTENRRLLVDLAAARDQLRHQSLHDPLTGLANRVLFTDRLEHALAVRQDEGAGVAVLFCDIDDFKTVNDELGHSTGDQVLRLVADRIREVLRPRDTVARLGGDEFAVLLEGSHEAVQVAECLVAAVARPCLLEDRPVLVSLSVGIAIADVRPVADRTHLQADRTGQVVSDLLRQADTAMYAAKAGGKGRAVLYPELCVGWGQLGDRRPSPAPAPAPDPPPVPAPTPAATVVPA